MSFEANKIAAALLVAMILAMVSGILAEKLIHPEMLAKNDLGEALFATPAFIGNAIYVRTPTKLYAFSN